MTTSSSVISIAAARCLLERSKDCPDGVAGIGCMLESPGSAQVRRQFSRGPRGVATVDACRVAGSAKCSPAPTIADRRALRAGSETTQASEFPWGFARAAPQPTLVPPAESIEDHMRCGRRRLEPKDQPASKDRLAPKRRATNAASFQFSRKPFARCDRPAPVTVARPEPIRRYGARSAHLPARR
jgi:hypothetical protein